VLLSLVSDVFAAQFFGKMAGTNKEILYTSIPIPSAVPLYDLRKSFCDVRIVFGVSAATFLMQNSVNY
jgi:TctA family transporter